MAQEPNLSHNRNILHPVLIGLMVFALGLVAAGCAKGPFPIDTGGGGGTAAKTITFTLTVNEAGQIDRTGKGLYLVLFNILNEAIDSTNDQTFMNFIRFDGTNWHWYRRRDNVPPPGFTWEFVGNVNNYASISGDGKSMLIKFDNSDPNSFLNQYVVSSNFSVHVITTDNTGGPLMGRAFDTIGQGPDLTNNSTYTMYMNKLTGIRSPIPANYPNDPTADYRTWGDLAQDFPYVNFDIITFQITVQ